ncbi:MAG: GH32 C-terminal domain-containing protein, partial [Candidatus Pararuminococcus gallinarum]
SWVETADGMQGNNLGLGDTFYTSDKNMPANSAFVLEADMHLEDGQAAGLTFGIQSRETPKATWYCVNVDKSMKITKLFKNTGGEVWNINRALTDKELEKKDFKIRIEYLDGGRMNFYLDGALVGSQQENDFAGGYIGIMTFRSNATFNNVMFYEAENPQLTALEVKDVEIIPTFNADTYQYNATVPFETESVEVKATAAEGFSLSINDEAAENDTYVSVPLEVGTNDVLVKAIDDETGISSITTVSIKREQDPAFFYTEQWRPQFHYSQEIGWCNDPNGMVYFDGEWHLFYQYNVQKTWTSMHWGHAVSTDLIHWEELPIALYPDENGTIFSGSAVVDKENTTHFFDGIEGGGLVAIFTHDGGGQKQSLAYSLDKGRTWIKYEGNPVLTSKDDPCKDGAFRDPKVFWHEESGKWMMAVAGGPFRIFSSTNLIDWEVESVYNQNQVIDGKQVNSIYSECPDFFKLEVGDTGTYKWVYSGGGRYYMIGDFKEVEGKWYFIPDTNEQFTTNYAPDAYAAQTYFGWDKGGTPDGRRIMIQWMSNWAYANNLANITDPYNNAQTLMYELTLEETENGIRLFQNPISEYDSLRQVDKATVVDTTLTPDGENPLAGFSGDQYEIVAEFTPTEDTTQVGFKLRTGGDQETLVYYNLQDGRMYIDRTKSGKDGGGGFLGVYSQQTSMTEDGKIQMRIYVDWSAVEVFGNYGETLGTALIFPDYTSTGAEVYTVGGDADVNATIYPLDSIWRETPDTPAEASQVTINADGTKVYVDDTVTLSARVLPVSAEQKVEWEVTGIDGQVEIVSQTDNTITLKGVTVGDVQVTATVPGTEISDEGTLKVIEPNFNTNLTGWETVGGTWAIDENGYYGVGAGDMFTVAKESAKDFTLTADVTLESGDAFGIVFGAQDANAGQGSYVLNFDLSSEGNGQRFRIFEFPYRGADISDVAIKTFAELGFTPERGKTYPVELTVKDGKMSFTFDGKEVFKDVEDTNNTQFYSEGRIGFMGYNATVRAQNFFVTTDSPIESVVTVIDPIELLVGSAETALTDRLPDTVTVQQEDGIRKDVAVTWNIDDVKLDEVGEYTAVGTIDGFDTPINVKVIVKAEKVIESLTPEEINVSAVEGSTPEEVWEKIDKNVTANYSDGSTANLVVSDWDYSNVNFDEPGTYVATGTLTLDGEVIEMTIAINVTITAEGGQENPGTDKPSIPGSDEDQVGGGDWNWPSGSGNGSANGSGSGDKENPSSGDSSMIAGALAVLALSAGAAVVLIRKKK